MMAVKDKISSFDAEIKKFKQDNNIADQDELLPETYLKLKYPDNTEM